MRETFVIGTIIGLCFGLCFGLIIGSLGTSLVLKKAAIEHNCAQYNPKTGDFEWREK